MQDGLPPNQVPSSTPVAPPVAASPMVEPLSAPTPQVPVEPVVPTPTPPTPEPLKSGSNKFLWVAIGVLVVAALVAAAYFLIGNNGFGAKPTPTPEASTLVTPSPLPTEGWKTYQGETVYTKDGSTLFEVKYPPLWVLNKTILYPFGEPKGTEIVTKLLLGAGGHGWTGTIEKRTFPAGEASYSWVDNGKIISAFGSFTKNSNTYILEIQNLATDKGTLIKPIFDNMLESFKFIEATASATPTGSPTASPSSTPTSSPNATPSY